MKKIFKLLMAHVITFGTSIFLGLSTIKADEVDTGSFGTNVGTCEEILGPNLTKVIAACFDVLIVVGIVSAIINASLSLIPAISDPSKMGAAKKKCLNMAAVLLAIALFPTLLRVIAIIFNYDISCLV